ncbi:MAG: DUF3343 domain-containing protein [Tepidibacter sp.]|uniref:DUF3343 domain-containing protein n=1 Tax=Tepidibacter sp. TaxID=2529387 RepID=UPI0025E221FD|nr:DUF3343 domain-containing protein [Tepidibacter sp.]MCT4507494.1 DUF3343 domain-containing protein [Tepidibacter sp.]
MIKYYILFDSYNDGFCFEKVLKKDKIKYTIVPTPRIISKCCGMSIMLKEEVLSCVHNLVNKNKLKNEGLYRINKEVKTCEKLW